MISSSPYRALHAERRQRRFSPLRLLASLGLFSLAVWMLVAGRTAPSFTVAPMVGTMLAVALLFPWGVVPQAFAALAIAAVYVAAADWAAADTAEMLATFAAGASGLLVSVITAAYTRQRAVRCAPPPLGPRAGGGDRVARARVSPARVSLGAAP